MLTAIFLILLLTLVVAQGVGLPWLGLHLELTHQRQRRHVSELARRIPMIGEGDTTTHPYRQLSSRDAEFSLTSG